MIYYSYDYDSTLAAFFGLIAFLTTGFISYDSSYEDSGLTTFPFFAGLSTDTFLTALVYTILVFVTIFCLASESTDSAFDPLRGGFFLDFLGCSGVSYSSESSCWTTLDFFVLGGVTFLALPFLMFAISYKGLLSSLSESYILMWWILQ